MGVHAWNLQATKTIVLIFVKYFFEFFLNPCFVTSHHINKCASLCLSFILRGWLVCNMLIALQCSWYVLNFIRVINDGLPELISDGDRDHQIIRTNWKTLSLYKMMIYLRGWSILHFRYDIRSLPRKHIDKKIYKNYACKNL